MKKGLRLSGMVLRYAMGFLVLLDGMIVDSQTLRNDAGWSFHNKEMGAD